MTNKERLRKIHRNILITALPVTVLEWVSVVLWITKGFWWLLVVYTLIAVPFAIVISHYYFDHVACICPQCHAVFEPKLKEAFFAKHIPTARKLTCTRCGYHGSCAEVAIEEEK